MNAPTPAWVDPNPPSSTNPRANTMLAIAGVLLTLVVLAALVGVVLAKRGTRFGHGKPPDTVVLVAAGASVADPLTPPAITGSVGVAPTTLQQIQTMTQQMQPSKDRGVRLVSGTHPGLYGGGPQYVPCDVAAIANYLDGRPDNGHILAAAEGIRREQIPAFLNTLTPVILTVDTWVTFHGRGDGHGTQSQAVLQAGNAVMIDQAGVPRVHCTGGNPLEPPANENLTALPSSGRSWPGYDPQGVVAIAYTDSPSGFSDPVPTTPASEFSLLDLTTGQPMTRNTGGTVDVSGVPAAVGTLPDPIAANRPPGGAGRGGG